MLLIKEVKSNSTMEEKNHGGNKTAQLMRDRL